MRTVLSLALAIVVILGGVAGCSEARITSVASATPTEGNPNRAPDPALAAAINDFGFDLMREVALDAGAGSRENVVVSPLSIHAALTMTLNGARDTTAEEMRAVLRLGALELDDTNQAYADLLAAFAALDASSDTTLTVANSLWPDVDLVDLVPDFAETDRRYFGAHIEPIDLSAPDAADIINAWIAEQTAGDVTELIDEVDGFAVLYLVNALHLNAEWEEPFSESSTVEREFRFSIGPADAVTVPFMHQAGTYRYLESEGWRGVRLPFADSRLGMWVLLQEGPFDCLDYGSWLDAGVEHLDAALWREMTDSATNRHGELALPRVTSRYHTDLAAALSSMGMTEAFGPSADFGGMTGSAGDFIGRVLHETLLDVAETGVRASAATATEMLGAGEGAFPGGEPFEMIVDRPFLVAIDLEPTGEMLFLGAIHDPTEESR